MASTPQAIDAAAARLGLYRMEPQLAPLAATQVRQHAAVLGLALPADYVDFCTRFGAAAFDRQAVHPLPPHCPLGGWFWVDLLYAVGASEQWDPLELWQRGLADRLPAGLLPIGSDPGGNLLLLGCGRREGVYAWDHEHRELAPGELRSRTADLRAAGIDTSGLDVDQILLHWELEHPGAISNPSGHGNLYALAASFEALCANLVEASP